MWHQRKVAPLATGLVLILSAGCTQMYDNHGYVPPDDALARISLGDSRDEVAETVGRPVTTALEQDGDWYYVRSRYRTFAFRAPQEVDREVVAISFAGDAVSNVERFGLEEGNVVALSRRVTDEATEGVGFLRQLLGNVGQLDAQQFAGPDPDLP